MARYYENFPQAPVAVISGLSAICRIPTLVDARACRDDSLILEVLVTEDFLLSGEHLDAVMDFCEVKPDDVFFEPTDRKDVVVIVLLNTKFDFKAMYPKPVAPVDRRGQVDLDVKVVVDENDATKITFNKKALMEAPLSRLIKDISTTGQPDDEVYEDRDVALQRTYQRGPRA